MPYEMAPYQLTTLTLIAFSAVVIQAGTKWSGTTRPLWMLGVLLVASCFHMAVAPIALGDDSAWAIFGVALHAILRLVFAVTVSWAALHILHHGLTFDP